MAEPRAAELLSFAEYCGRAGLSAPLRAGFEAHVKLTEGHFNYRGETEWDRLKMEFLNQARRRA